MNKDQLRWGSDPNHLKLKILHPTINPVADMVRGVPFAGMIIEMPNYHLDDVLVQLIEDYGEETLIKRIKEL